MDNINKLQETAAKWEQLTRIGWKVRSNSTMTARFNRCMDRMSNRQMQILIVLECLDINTISEMAELLKISKSTLSIIMNKLVSKELVVKEYPSGGSDGRRVYFKILPKGHEILQKMGEYYIEGLSAFYSKFNDEGKKLFLEGVACLRKASNAEKTLFAIMTNSSKCYDKYDDKVKQIAKDMAFFFLNCRVTIFADDEVALHFKITHNQFELLLYILNGMDSLTKLERHLGSSGSTLSIGISKMVEKGYLYKEYPDMGQDRRKVFIRVTDKGKETVAMLKQIMNTHFIKYLSTLSEENLKIFDHGCDCLLKSFENF